MNMKMYTSQIVHTSRGYVADIFEVTYDDKGRHSHLVEGRIFDFVANAEQWVNRTIDDLERADDLASKPLR